jgi:hypothetical protein
MTVLGASSEARGRSVESSGGRALGRPLVLFDIFTDSSSSSGGRNAKGCVCTGLVRGEGRRYGCKTNGNVKDSRLKGKSRRLRQFRKQCQRRAQQAAPLPIQHLHQEQRLPGSMKPNRPLQIQVRVQARCRRYERQSQERPPKRQKRAAATKSKETSKSKASLRRLKPIITGASGCVRARSGADGWLDRTSCLAEIFACPQ